ncbi:NnrS family protein [Thioalkalivibrio sulfidiphilus]|uniref:NnrS family protein n=1 Tax=Thioalkalivibrio sulfidiphilus (strain HL-EbGR7) TaxID=396588 RepID=B8GM49_THISH|nr:NnrS family protein [Thioalkalivibrio sulfidiphilus]ACL73636.1 NnrS family protein [Thioalkalivibrio sulfidiphilus HL-EbGr7]
MLTIEPPGQYRISLLHLGFRPFFLLAGAFSVVSTLLWAWLYHGGGTAPSLALSPMTWHAHEMIFGYGLAVVAGFLLTAVRNWTGVQTLNGMPLLLLALCWLGARVLGLIPHGGALAVMAVLDLGFNLALVLAVARPVARARQWGQGGVVAIPLFLALANGLFYLGALGRLPQGTQAGLYLGLYLLVLLIMVMGRRVVPFFIEKGLGENIRIRERAWLDQAIVISLALFILAEVFMSWGQAAAWLAVPVFLLQVLRLYDWHTPGIWKKPLLWSLYLAFVWIAAGFGLKAAVLIMPLNPFLATHALAYGGIGLITLSMMSRVSLGHTGRNVFEPPPILGWLFAVLVVGAVIRVLLPLGLPTHHGLWIGASQALWAVAFGGFVWIYAPMLIRPRIDGRYG